MLLIGDVHITTRMTDRIITMLRDFVDANPTEQNIVFVGDYVYHFAYDRVALFALYEFFVQLFEQGKSVFVLAGNHDRLGDSFVYAEVKKAFDLLHVHSEGKLHFITQPEVHTIDGENVLLFPYMIHKVSDMPTITAARTEVEQSIQTQITTLTASDNKNEQFSAYINALLLSYTQQYDTLTVIHHYYTNAIQFPGYASRFAFKDIALSDYFLDLAHIRLISWHIHAPFIYKNYCCIGSVWSTSSLEHNTIKWLFHLQGKKLDMTIHMLNPYWVFGQDVRDVLWLGSAAIREEDITTLYHHIRQEYAQSLASNDTRNIMIHHTPLPPLEQMHIQLIVDSTDYDNLAHYVDDTILAQCKDIKLKKYNPAVQDLMEQFTASNQKIISTFSDRKQVLKDYVQTKYPDDYVKYEEVLQELKVL